MSEPVAVGETHGEDVGEYVDEKADGSVEERLAVLQGSLFFEGFDPDDLQALARLARPVTVAAGEQIVGQGEPATALYVLSNGTVELSSRLVGSVRVGDGADGDAPDRSGTDGRALGREGSTIRPVAAPGYPLGLSAMVEPHVHRVTATATSPTRLLRWDRSDLQAYAEANPQFGVRLMQGILSLLSARLRAARLRLVARRYDAEVVAIESLLEQQGEQLSVASPLHKVPHYLQNRLTLADALDVVEMLHGSGDRVERHLADEIGEILDDVRRELRIYQRLQAIYELVAAAPDDVDPVALREESCRRFAELFSDTRHVIRGLEHLPAQTGCIVVMNHLVNHVDNLLPNRFTLTLDTHFVSAMLLHRHYGQAPVRVIRASGRREYGHRRYYDRLGYIYVSSRVPGEESARPVDAAQFQEQAAAALAAGQNIVICPEGTSVPTEESPLRFRPGAFRLAASLQPEPLIVPVAVANFDKQLTRTAPVAVVHEPFRVSEAVDDPSDKEQLLGFLNDRLHPAYTGWVRDAVALGRAAAG